MVDRKEVAILGIRGIPAAHGGFETFAERLAMFLVGRGWRVTVYCQEEGRGSVTETSWAGVRRIHIPAGARGSLGTVLFDLRSMLHAQAGAGVILTLGYNTAIFGIIPRMRGRRNLINMDGIEWRRAKWGRVARFWFWVNERLGCWLGNGLIADHPEIATHLASRVSPDKIKMIPYGGDEVVEVSSAALASFQVEPNGYSLVVARAEPENSILEIVKGFSSVQRNHKLLLLGRYEDHNSYHRAVRQAASNEVVFVGAIYDRAILASLRFHARVYVHGHQVGGTNPSLVEALGAGSAVLAHDNRFNRWVADDAALYFINEAECSARFSEMLSVDFNVGHLRAAARRRHKEDFVWADVLASYERLLSAEEAGAHSEVL